MAVRVASTLARMAEIYRLPADGGAGSPRFVAYAEAARAGAPVASYNPMTAEPAGDTVAALLGVDAEALATRAANAVLEEIRARVELTMFVTVATPGMWTDRLATEAEHLFDGRRSSEILFWTGEATDAETVLRRARAQTVRAAWAQAHGLDRGRDTVRQAVAREGMALAVGRDGPPPLRDDAVVEALAILGARNGYGDKVALVLGDRYAEAMGFTPLGVGEWAGARHGAARCERTDLAAAFESGRAAPWI